MRKRAVKFTSPFLQDWLQPIQKLIYQGIAGKNHSEISWANNRCLSVERSNKKNLMNLSPACPLETFYPDASILLVTEVHSIEEGCLQERKPEIYSSQEECHPWFPKHHNMGHVLWSKSKNPSTAVFFTLVQMFLFICLLLSFTVLTAPVRTKKSISVQNKYLWDKLNLLDLLRLELLAPAMTCAPQLPSNSPWHTIHLPAGQETPRLLLSVTGVNKALRKTQIYLHLSI